MMKKSMILAILIVSFSAVNAMAQLRSEVWIGNPAFVEKFKFSIEVYARTHDRSAAFELGSTRLRIRFNASVLSIPNPVAALSAQHADFNANADYEPMRLEVEGTDTVILSVEPRRASGRILPRTETRLARITFDISEANYRTQRSSFELLRQSTMLAADGWWVFMGRESLGRQSLICYPSIGDIQSPLTAVIDQAFTFVPDADACAGGGALTFDYQGLPGWLTFNPNTGVVSGTAPSYSLNDTYRITMRVADAYLDTASSSFVIGVACQSGPLTLSGSPVTSIAVGASYVFQPTVQSACGRLTFSIQNRPSWAQFDTSTGRLSGTPSLAHVGTTGPITIRVEDESRDFDTITFTIAVTLGCSAPEISGTPPGTVTSGREYSFTPTVRNGCHPLAFSIENKPGWVDFDEDDGTLSGTSPAGYVGTTDNIRITVTDDNGGSSTLGPFSISVGSESGGGSGGGCFISTLRR